jgi:hypothetical protein
MLEFKSLSSYASPLLATGVRVPRTSVGRVLSALGHESDRSLDQGTAAATSLPVGLLHELPTDCLPDLPRAEQWCAKKI